MSDKRISVAPMMGMTDRHFRFMASLLCDKVSLYTPMIHVDAINQSDKNFLKKENKDSKAVGIQIAGNDPVAIIILSACINISLFLSSFIKISFFDLRLPIPLK